MPSWNIHLAIANDINKKLKLDKNSFYLGNTLPDVDYGMNTIRKETHFYNFKCPNFPKEILPNINDFLKKYKNKLNNPLIMGMYVHLLTDYYFNNEIFSNYWVQDTNGNVLGAKLLNGKITTELKEYKHYDLELYGKYLFNNIVIELPKFDNNILINKKDINIKDYTEEVLKKRIDYLNNQYVNKNKYKIQEKLFGLKYKMIPKEVLDKMYLNCIKFIEQNIKDLKK